MTGERILVVDDEANLRDLCSMYLQRDGFMVETTGDGVDAFERLQSDPPSLVVLDLMLPGMDGYEICRRIRADSDLPILMLTARSDDVDKIVGLELGADDYLTKPFNPRELVARVRAILRRTAGREPRTDGPITVGDVVVDPARYEVHIAGKPVQLRAKEFDLLRVFAEHAGFLLSRQQLLELVWGYDFLGETRTVDVHVAHLRKRLAESANVRIETITGAGYKLVAD